MFVVKNKAMRVTEKWVDQSTVKDDKVDDIIMAPIVKTLPSYIKDNQHAL